MKKTLKDVLLEASTGADDAETELIKRYANLIKKIAGKYYAIPGYEPDDLFQQGVVKMLEIVHKFDAEKSDTFSAYLGRSLNNHYNELARNSVARKNRANVGALSFEGKEDNYDGDGEQLAPAETVPSSERTPEEKLLDKERDAAFYDELKSILSPFELQVLVPYFNGQTYRDIARALGVTVKKVDNALASAKRKYLRHKGETLARYKKKK